MDDEPDILVSQTDDGLIAIKLFSWFGSWRLHPKSAEELALAILQFTRPEAFVE